MKITKTAIHKLTVQADCGCIAYGEYQDEALKKTVAGPLFSPCDTHKENPGASVIEGLLKEVVIHTAAETKVAPPPAPAPSAPPPHIDGAIAARRAERVAAAAPASETNGGTPPAAVAGGAAAPATPGIPGATTRTPIAVKPGSHRPGTKEPRVVGGNPHKVRLHDPTVTGRGRTGTGTPGGPKVASAASAVTDMDGVPEDRRVTALVENIGLLDDGDDDADGDEFFS
jgi:hypothetical protein